MHPNEPIPEHALRAAVDVLRRQQARPHIPIPFEQIPAERQRYWLEIAAEVFTAGLAAIHPGLLCAYHRLVTRSDDGTWTLAHPMSCHGSLFACNFDSLVHEHLTLVGPDMYPSGEYLVVAHPDGGVLVASQHHATA